MNTRTELMLNSVTVSKISAIMGFWRTLVSIQTIQDSVSTMVITDIRKLYSRYLSAYTENNIPFYNKLKTTNALIDEDCLKLKSDSGDYMENWFCFPSHMYFLTSPTLGFKHCDQWRSTRCGLCFRWSHYIQPIQNEKCCSSVYCNEVYFYSCLM